MTDLFCGAGGSSTGATQVPGVTVRVASNHWNLAIDTHNTNHPDADHICADLSQIDPRLFPTSDILWASPSCTKHSVAQGKKRADAQPDLFGEVLPDAAAERSRATMWDVVRFAEYHAYEAVIVENVVEVTAWPPYRAWLAAMQSLGYRHQVVMLNSMHAQLLGDGAPQSRDRFYCVFWRDSNRAPDLHRVTRPHAVCPTCGPVQAMQSWKNPDRAPIGKYRAQYVYRCPNVACRNQVVEPIVRPAADIIDWTLTGTRLGDRAKPLADKTMARIRAGVDRYWRPLLVPVEGRDGKVAVPVDAPARTMTTRSETALLVPTGGTWRTDAAPTSAPFATRTTTETDGLAFVAELRGGGSVARRVSDPLATVTASGNHHALVMRNNSSKGDGAEMVTPATEPVRTITTAGHQSLITAEQPTIDLDDVRFRMLEPGEIARAMDFPTDYAMLGTRREQVRLAGNAVTPPAARDLVHLVAESLAVVA